MPTKRKRKGLLAKQKQRGTMNKRNPNSKVNIQEFLDYCESYYDIEAVQSMTFRIPIEKLKGDPEMKKLLATVAPWKPIDILK